ncbi:MAG: hypothetical protein JWM99_1039, partial [Verrucomicrobiales bacterium]|nr:hypothetical protein [Verrucomicrobiales bacterium]
VPLPSLQNAPAATRLLYSIGNPTDEEQLFLELVNRARMNPAQEGILLRNSTDPQILNYYSFFQVNLDAFTSAMSKIQPTQPLAMNAALTAAARIHSLDMFNNTYQEHVSPIDGTGHADRAIAAGYPADAFSIAENIYADARSVIHGHAGFEVDWGNDPSSVNGMQNPPHHRLTIHSPGLREVGMGVVLGEKSAVTGVNYLTQNVGPLVVTQDFGQAQNADQHPFITGVAYYDFNANGQYDLGEGLGGVHVTVDGFEVAAVTADAGGYAIPVTPNRTYRVTFSAQGLDPKPVDINVATNNVKIDFTPLYSAPVVNGPNPALTLRTNAYQFGAVGSAMGYQWRQWTRVPTVVEGAENGLTKITATVAADAPPIVTDIKASGAHGFHMMHTPTGTTPQSIALDRFFLVNTGGSLQFSNRLAHANTNEVARTQISVDEGQTWTDLSAQTGAGLTSPGQTSFSPKVISLAPYAGKLIQIRFVYDISSGTFTFAASGYGWYIDEISFTNVEELTNPLITGAGNQTSFGFAPSVAADYTLEVRAQLASRLLPWGPIKSITAIPGPPVVHLSEIKSLARGMVEIDFSLDIGTNTSFTLQSAPGVTTPSANWTAEVATTTSTGAKTFRFVLPRTDPSTRFYRVLVN